MVLFGSVDSFKNIHPALFSLLIVVFVIGIAILLQATVSSIMVRVSKKYKANTLLILTKRFRIPVLLFSIIFGMSLAAPLVKLPANTQFWLEHLLSIMGIIALTWTVINLVAIFRTLILYKYDIKVADNFKARKIYTQLRVVEQIINAFIIVLAFAAILMTFDRIKEVGLSVLASAGVATAIIGFAAQKSLSTLLAGLQVALTQPIRIDDVVIVEKEFGTIEEITLSYVVLRLWDKRRLVVPINYFLEKPFENWSRRNTDLIGVIMIYTDYSIPVAEIRTALDRILEQHPLWDKQTRAVQVTDARPEVIELRVLVSATNAPKTFDLRCDIREKLIQYIKESYPTSLPRTRIEIDNKNVAR